MGRLNTIVLYCVLCIFSVGSGVLIGRIAQATGAAIPGDFTAAASAARQTAVAALPQPPTETATAAPTPTSRPTATATAPPPTPAPSATATPAPTETPLPPPEPTTVPLNYIEYTVQRGDLLTQIAEKYGVTTKDILAINVIPRPDSLNVGAVIRIPKR